MSNLSGAFTPFSSDISEEANVDFEKAVKPLLGVNYKPVAVATQVVAGLNYVFFCNATVVSPGSLSYPVMVSVFRDLEGQSSITHINRLEY